MAATETAIPGAGAVRILYLLDPWLKIQLKVWGHKKSGASVLTLHALTRHSSRGPH